MIGLHVMRGNKDTKTGVRSVFKSMFFSRDEVREQSSPFLLTSGFGSHVANPSYAVML